MNDSRDCGKVMTRSRHCHFKVVVNLNGLVLKFHDFYFYYDECPPLLHEMIEIQTVGSTFYPSRNFET